MKKPNIIQENIFATLARTFAALNIGPKLKKIVKEVDNDPVIASLASSVVEYSEKLEKALKDHCKVYPWSEKCKDIKKGK